MTKAEQIIEKISNGVYSEKELIALYRNAEKAGENQIMRAVRSRMRADFPRAANRMFGAKDGEARALLEGVWKDLEGMISLANNKLGNGVKTGGSRIAGEKYIDLYISYKNSAKFGVFLSLVQDHHDSELFARVGRYRTGSEVFREEVTFQMHEFDRAVALFKDFLSEVV